MAGPGEVAVFGPPTVPAIFPMIVGRGRSGTTLLRAILASHPDLAIPEESHFIAMLRRPRRYERPDGFAVERFAEDISGVWWMRRWGLSEPEVRAALEAAAPRNCRDAIRALYRLYARREGKGRYGDKTPIYVLHIAFLARLFPEARFVHVIRDGRDVALSFLDASFGPSTIAEAAWSWRRAVRRGRSAGRRLGSGRYLEVRYEELVADPERSTRHVCDFIGLPFEERMLRYFEQGDRLLVGIDNPHEHTSIMLPPTKGLRDWRRQMSKADVSVFEAIAGDLLSELGYERSNGSPSLGTRIHARAEWMDVQRKRAERRLAKLLSAGRRATAG